MNRASTFAVIDSEGHVTLSFTAIFSAICPQLNATFFPFDDFSCFFEFGSWTYDGSEVDLFWTKPNATGSFKMQKHNEWLINQTEARKIVEKNCCPPEDYPIVRIFLHFKRRPLYYIYNLGKILLKLILTQI